MRSYGIVLHSVRYNDTQLIIDIFTESAGMVPVIVKIPRRGRQGAKACVWQPLSLVELVWEPRLNANLQKPTEISLWRPWRSLSIEPFKAAMSLFMSEFLYDALRREQENKPLFEFMVNALSWFDETDTHFVNFHIFFLLHLTRFLGFFPNVEDWQEGSYFDLESATFTFSCPSHIHFLHPHEAALVPKFLRMNLRSMQAVGLNREIRRRALNIVADFYRLHIPEFPEIRSLDVLAEVFA